MDLADLVRGVNHHIEQALEAELKPKGMSLHHYRVLEALAARNGQPMGDLAARLFIDSPTLTRIIDRMVASAEVYRGPDPHDRRKVLVFLSRKGAAQFEGFAATGASVEQQMLDQLGTSKAATLARLLSELIDLPFSRRAHSARENGAVSHK
ncbi:MarR family winged helix-turn-helix transcriptional regulator [Bradyrhizobium sp.]|uniref:MarR family winged helix-turn-helix transcriptional regulator n=1 Tax=Bradyrhizobium sp. TaxID=376 RepID=UPI0039E59300